jgi:hypothetical protein
LLVLANPPTDPGRVPLSHRFLQHAPLIMVAYPGEQSLKQIPEEFLYLIGSCDMHHQSWLIIQENNL